MPIRIARRRFLLVLAAAVPLATMAAPRAGAQSYGPPYRISGSFENPFGIAVDMTNGNLIVSDTRNRQLQWTTLASLGGTPSFQTFGLAATASADALIDPQGIAADAAGHVYVVDARRNLVKMYTWNAPASNYVLDPAFAAGATTSAGGVGISGPRDVAVAADGKVYLLDSGNHRVLRADGPTGTAWTVFLDDATLSNPYGIDVGPDGRIYIADTDHDRVLRYNSAGTSPVIFGHTGTAGGELRSPRDVSADIDGRMYIVDHHNHRVEILDLNGAHVRSLGRAPTLGGIQKIAVDPSKRIFLADADFDVVLAFLGPDAPVPFDAWTRDYVGDNGAEPSDPAFTLGSPDLIIRRAADVDVVAAQTAGLESMAFQSPRFGEDNFVYVAVRNRGVQLLTDAVAKLYWADPATLLTFPGDWQSTGFVHGTVGEVFDNSLIVPPIPPGESRVLGPVRWRPPAPELAGLGGGAFALGVRIIQPFDIAENGAGAVAVRASNNVAIRTVYVSRGPFPTGDQNTLVVRAGYSDDMSSVDQATTEARITALGTWVTEVSWGVATIKPLYRGQINLPNPRSYYAAPTRTKLIEMTQDALSILLTAEPDLLDGVLPTPGDDIGRILIVTNDPAADIDWATTGSWPYTTPGGEDRYLTASVQGVGNTSAAFAHGLGHQVGMLDLFAYPNVVFPRPFADGWDNMATPFSGVHPTVWSKELATWVSAYGAPIVFIPRPARATTYATTSPIHLFHQATATPGQTVGIALGLTPGVGTLSDETAFYYLEARAPSTGGADATVPGAGALMYYVNARIPQGQGPIIVRDHIPGTPALTDAAIPDGGNESPAGTGIIVNVGAGTTGAAHDISLTYTPPPTGYDVWMTTGDPAWTSPDIWVDNQSDGYDLESGRTPTDNGDRAIGGEENRIYARVRNAGEADAFDVEVAFFISEPYHTLGGEADFTLLKSVVITRLEPGDTKVYVTWTPSVNDPHTCVKVVLRRLLDDTNPANNSAQQNLRVDWSSTGSPFTPVTTTFQITNPDSVAGQLVYFRADEVPSGWIRQLVPSRAYLAPKQKITVSLTLTPPPNAPNCTAHAIPVTAWTPKGHTLVRVGGTTVNVNLAKQAGLDMKVDTLTCSDQNYKLAYTKQEQARAEAGRTGAVPHLGAAGRAGLVGAALVKEAVAPGAKQRQRTVFLAARGTVVPGAGGPVVTYDSAANPGCQGKQCLILRTRGCTDPVQANAEVVVRYRDASGKPEYRVVKTDSNGCFEDFQILTAGGDWTVTALIEGSPCLVPIEVTQIVHTPLPTGTDTAGPSLSTPTIVRPVYVKARGALTMRAKATPCQNCRAVQLTHRVKIELIDVMTGAGFGSLTADSLVSALAPQASNVFPAASKQTGVGVHVGAGSIKLEDGTVVVGVMRGTINLTSHLRTGQVTAGPAGARPAYTFEGEFIGRAADGRRRGCKLVLHYALTPATDPAQGSAQATGLADGVWECPCEKGITSAVPPLDTLPDGCVIPFVTWGEGRWRQVVARSLKCGSSKVTGEITSGTATTGAGGGPPALTDGTFTFDSLTHIHSGNLASPALHGGGFTYVSAAGDRIAGRLLSGLTYMNPHRGSSSPGGGGHLEGILKGLVTAGVYTGCELRGVYSATVPGVKKTSGPGFWWISGAIVCPCARGRGPGPIGGRDIPGTVGDSGLVVPEWVRDSIRRQITLDSVQRVRSRDSALVAKYGSASRLTRAERVIADHDGDGKVSPLEVANFSAMRKLFVAQDRNRNRELDLQEYASGTVERMVKMLEALAERYSSKDTAQARLPEAQRRLLAGADSNKDRTISADELRALATRGARQQFGRLDKNHDGRLTIDEFAAGGLLRSP